MRPSDLQMSLASTVLARSIRVEEAKASEGRTWITTRSSIFKVSFAAAYPKPH